METPKSEPPVPGREDTASTEAEHGEDLEETFVAGEADSEVDSTASSSATHDELASKPSSKRRSKSSRKSRSGQAVKKSRASQLGDFKLLKKIGEGGMGEVYLARQKGLDRKVALKVLSKELGKKETFVERFFREARAMAKLDHPNVVKVYAVETDQGRHYVAIEFIDGQSMQDWMDQLGRLEVADAVTVTLRCAEALKHANDQTLVHRDVKPDNVLVTKSGLVKVADFGLAKAADDDLSMTQSGTGLGTPLYMAPEQARDAKSVDLRADIYALGSTLYYFLTGKLPFEGTTALELIIAKEKGLFTSARKLNTAIPDRLDLMVDRMIAKSPDHRYGSYQELIADLESLGLEVEELGFIAGGGTAAATAKGQQGGRSTGASTRPSRQASASTPPSVSLPPSSADDAAKSDAKNRRMADAEEQWYIQHANAKGRTVVTRMTTSRVRELIEGKLLDLKARGKLNESESFLPLAHYPEFEPLVKKRLSKARADSRGGGLQQIYKKLDQEERRNRRWRSFSYLFRGFMGWFWGILALAIVIALILGAWLYFDETLGPKIKQVFGWK